MRIIITEQQFNLILLGEGAKSLWWKEIKQAVKLCNNIDEFEIKFNQLYDSARKQGLVWYIKTLFYDKMTPEQIKREILDGDYKGRDDLKKKNLRLYNLSGKISKKYNLTKGVDDILTQAFPIYNIKDATVDDVVNFIKWNVYNSRTEFANDKINGGKSVYDSVDKDVRNKALNIVFPDTDRISWTPDLIRQEFKKGDYKRITDLQIKNKALYGAAERRGMLDELIPDKYKWTPKLIRQEFKKGDYKGRNDLQKKNVNLYQAAHKYGMLDELLPNKLNISWTPELIRQEFKKGDYRGRLDLANKNPKLYDAAHKRGMLDELFPKK
jgi:hypothetical protein